MSRSVKIACCQISPAVGDKPGNLERVQAAVARAAAEGAVVVVLPELANTVVTPRSRIAASSSRTPSNGWISPSMGSNSAAHAARASSPRSFSNRSPAMCGTSWSPPIPIARWSRQTGTVTSKRRNARNHARACW